MWVCPKHTGPPQTRPLPHASLGQEVKKINGQGGSFFSGRELCAGGGRGCGGEWRNIDGGGDDWRKSGGSGGDYDVGAVVVLKVVVIITV